MLKVTRPGKGGVKLFWKVSRKSSPVWNFPANGFLSLISYANEYSKSELSSNKIGCPRGSQVRHHRKCSSRKTQTLNAGCSGTSGLLEMTDPHIPDHVGCEGFRKPLS